MELEMENGEGTSSLFVRDYAYFVGIEAIMQEEDFDPVNSKKGTKSGKQDNQARSRKEETNDFQYESSGNISCLVVFVSYGFKQQLFFMRLL